MSNIFWKSFHLCFSSSLLKCSSPQSLPSSDQDCPNRPSIFTNNFNFLYDDYHHYCHQHKRLTAAPSTTTTTTSSHTTTSSSYDSDNFDFTPDSPPVEFSAVFASSRFFFSSPGQSNSIIESLNTRSQYLTDKNVIDTENIYSSATDATTTVSRLIKGGVAVKQYVYSPDPYSDFRQSMQEMIDAMDIRDIKSDHCEFLHELLFCYLSLNPRHTHQFIFRAFADTLVSLLSGNRRKS